MRTKRVKVASVGQGGRIVQCGTKITDVTYRFLERDEGHPDALAGVSI
jgi:hypothetical protein